MKQKVVDDMHKRLVYSHITRVFRNCFFFNSCVFSFCRCESCVDLLFIKGSGACPECGTALRRNNFRLQLFEDPYIEKEIDIRKKILRE